MSRQCDATRHAAPRERSHATAEASTVESISRDLSRFSRPDGFAVEDTVML